ncbi:MAG: CCA tRNA nucleotidyltransferase [Thermoplasmata archaeon]
MDMSIESEVLKAIKPTPSQERKVAAVVEELSKRVVDAARRAEVHVEPMLVGSVAKGTHLKDPDIDMFMLFAESTPIEVLKTKGLEIGRAVIDGREHYAQHPYVRGLFKGFQVDLVPCYRIRDTKHKMSAVDRTPFHTEFVRKNLKKSQADEVRLLKRFMKGIECYGAEAKVQGFSGYLCELLVMRFGTFKAVLDAARQWKSGEVLALPGYEGKEFDDPLTFVDPVDPSRNVASAVSLETLLRFVMASREYIRTPSLKFFFPEERRPWPPEKIREVAGERLRNIVSVVFPKLDLIDDVLYPQLRKSLASMTSLLEHADFEVEKTTIHVDSETHLLIELTSMTLPRQRKHRGPPVNSENVNEFLAKWNSLGASKPYIESGRWYVMVERDYDRADALLSAKLKDIPLGKDVKAQGGFEIESGEQLLAEKHLGALTRHFDERMPWER